MQLQLSVPLAVRHLKESRAALTLSQAVRFLDHRLQSAPILELYEQLFPLEWATSTKDKNLEREHHAYSEREMEFFRLVDERLFPLDMDWLYDNVWEERTAVIPAQVWATSLDPWNEPIDEFRLGWQLLLVLVGFHREADIEFDAENRFFAPLAATVPGKASWDYLQEACQKAEEPVCHLCLAIDMLDHDTGNVWCDVTADMGFDYPLWSEEAVRDLADQFAEARELWLKTEHLLDWLEASPAHVKEIVQLWNNAVKHSAQQPSEKSSPTLPES
jgi:hypothetical protein